MLVLDTPIVASPRKEDMDMSSKSPSSTTNVALQSIHSLEHRLNTPNIKRLSDRGEWNALKESTISNTSAKSTESIIEKQSRSVEITASMRKQYFDLELSHSTSSKRTLENLNFEKIIQQPIICKEEMNVEYEKAMTLSVERIESIPVRPLFSFSDPYNKLVSFERAASSAVEDYHNKLFSSLLESPTVTRESSNKLESAYSMDVPDAEDVSSNAQNTLQHSAVSALPCQEITNDDDTVETFESLPTRGKKIDETR